MSNLHRQNSAQASQSGSERPSRHRTRTMPGTYHQDTSPTRSESWTNTDSITEYDSHSTITLAETGESSPDTPDILTNNSDDTKLPIPETGPSFSAMMTNFLLEPWESTGESDGKESHWGEWKDEAFDNEGNRLIPFLGKKEFEVHLELCNGYPRPTGLSYATPTWARLLYDFAIRPGMNVITWKPITPGCELDSHDMHLDIEGSVLCNIINLYEYEVTNDVKTIPYDIVPPQVDFDFPFGQIQVATSEGQAEVKFNPTSYKVKTPLEPFPNHAGDLRYEDGHQSSHKATIRFDSNVVISRYLRCIREGASRSSDLSLEWAKKSTSLQDLADDLIQNWSRVTMESDPRSPLLLTPEWLEEASRIKRLITTNSGADSGLADDLLENVLHRQAFYNAKNPENPHIPVHHPELIRSLCMFSDQRFRLCGPEPEPEIARQPGTVAASLGGAIDETLAAYRIEESLATYRLEETLATYGLLQPGTWKHELSVLGARNLQRVLALEHAVYHAHAKVLKFTPNSALWKGVYWLD